MPVSPPTWNESEDDGSVDGLIRALARLPTMQGDAHERGKRAKEFHEEHFEHFRRVTAGRYELLELLGAGGMGIVYAGRNVRTERAVAIKFLRQRSVERTASERERALRFVREARAAGRIHHVNVVDIYDVESDVDTPYLVMERLEGESLRQRLDRGPMSVLEAVRTVRQALSGVAEAHENGVIHRDLKPDNIFLALQRGRDEPVPKVLDFGVSRLLTSDGAATASSLTFAGHLLGTPAYMPVEQLRGDLDCDARVDVYALGVTLYEAIGGTRPVAAAAERPPRGATELVQALTARVPEVDAELARVLERAIALDRADRYPDARAFASELDRWLARRTRVRSARSLRGLALVASFAIVSALLVAWAIRLRTVESEASAVSADRSTGRRTSVHGAHAAGGGSASLAASPAKAQVSPPAHAPGPSASLEPRAQTDARDPRSPTDGRRAVSREAAHLHRSSSGARAAKPDRSRARAVDDVESIETLRDPSLGTDPRRALELSPAQF